MNAPKKPLVQIRGGSEKMTSKLSSPQPAGIDFQMGVARSVSSWMKMTKMNMEGGKSGPESDYARAEREQTKLQLHNITKRLCEVIENFDDGRSRVTEEQQEERDAQMQEREDVATMISDYGKVCMERKTVLESLDDWLKEGHIDDLDNVWEKSKKISSPDDFFILRQSLLVGKLAAIRLKGVYAELEKGAKQATNNLKVERQKLEDEVQATKEAIENIVDKKAADKKDKVTGSKSVSDMVKETWKYAAAEICDMLNRVKDHAGDTKALETKINKMVASMNQQSDVINQLNKKIQELEELIRVRDQMAGNLSDDNTQLKEGMDVLRGEVLKAKKQAAVLQTQLEQTEQEKGAALKKVNELSSKEKNKKVKKGETSESVKDEGTSDSTSTETLKALVSDLTKKNTKLEQDNSAIKATCTTLQSQLEVTVKKLEGERDQFKAELELIAHSSPPPAESRSPSSNSRSSGIKSRASNNRSRGSSSSRRGQSHPSPPLAAQVENTEIISDEKIRDLVEEVQKQTAAKEHLEKLATDVENKLKDAKDEIQHLENLVTHLQEELDVERDKNKSTMEHQVNDLQHSNAMYAERSKEHIEGKTLEMVADLLRKLNSDDYPFEIADSKTLKMLQEEAIRVNKVIESFMAYSTDVLNEEAVVMSNAVETLLSQLPPSERDEILNRSQINGLEEESKLDYAPPGHTHQDHIQPGHTQQNHIQPGHTQQNHTHQDHIQPGHTHQDHIQPGHTQQDHTQPGHSAPGCTQSSEPDHLVIGPGVGLPEPLEQLGSPDPPQLFKSHEPLQLLVSLPKVDQQERGRAPRPDDNPFNDFLSSILSNRVKSPLHIQAPPLQSGAQSTSASADLPAGDKVLLHAFDGIVDNLLGKSEEFVQQLQGFQPAVTMEQPSIPSAPSVQPYQHSETSRNPMFISALGFPESSQQLKNYANQAMKVLANYGASVLSPKLKLQHNKLRRVLNAMVHHKTSKGPGYKFPEVFAPENVTTLLQVQNYMKPGQSQQPQPANKLLTRAKKRGTLQGLGRFPLQDLSEKINQVQYLKDQKQAPPQPVHTEEVGGVLITNLDLTQPSNTRSSSPWVMSSDTSSSAQHTRRLPATLQRLQERQRDLPPPHPSANKPGAQMTSSIQLQAMPNIAKQTVLKTSLPTTIQPSTTLPTTAQPSTRRRREKAITEPPPPLPTPFEVDAVEKRGDVIDYLIGDLPMSAPPRVGKKVTHKSLFWSRRRYMQPAERQRKRKAVTPGSVLYKIPPDYVDIY